MIHNSAFRSGLVVVATCLAFEKVTSAQIYKSLYGFSGGSDGALPLGSLVQGPGGLLYGMTQFGGNGHDLSGKGVLFSFDPASNAQTVLHTFSGSPTDGAGPYGSPAVVGDTLYGMTNIGGTSPVFGTLFVLSIPNGTYSLVHSFAGVPGDGASPQGNILPSGMLAYGMTAGGGSSDMGSIFAYNPITNGLSILHSFSGAPNDGKFPLGSLIQSGNTLYGMSQLGGSANLGALFSFDVTTNKQTILHSFTGSTTDGSGPRGSLLQSGNLLYGMTHDGGANNLGAIFSYDLTTGTETLLHSFAGGVNDGASPFGSLIQSGNILYGMTRLGGSSSRDTDAGVVFAFDTASNALTILHAFTPFPPVIFATSAASPSALTPPDGAYPNGDLLLVGNALYGMTSSGTGADTYGTVFSITLPEPSSLALLALGVSATLVRRRRCGKL